ncbi:pyridoxal biosynthesis lyase PdxS [Bifidobacterium longum subsp. longum KACC 91563]|nr:pyridoxal biosynthesis lyase PdxS [Bifidobacterium longum subsp. longum KACC 91563]
MVSRFIIERIGLAHPNQSNLDGANPQLLHPSNPTSTRLSLPFGM